jgi:hypothetical protein
VVLPLLLCAACTADFRERDGPSDLAGRPVDPLAPSAARASVLLFVATDCPFSNRMAPEIRRLHERFRDRGVAFWLVYPNAADEPAAIRQHLARHGLDLPAVRDPSHRLVERAGVRVTPEAALFSGGDVVYRGRIDDRAAELGVGRPEPTRRDLEEAVAAVLAGREIAEPVTRAVGCFIAGPG